jgi:hypothetical protein
MRVASWERWLLRIVGWLTILTVWSGSAALKWLDLRDGLISQERFVSSVQYLSVQVALIIGVQVFAIWNASRPKPPLVYRSTILD